MPMVKILRSDARFFLAWANKNGNELFKIIRANLNLCTNTNFEASSGTK